MAARKMFFALLRLFVALSVTGLTEGAKHHVTGRGRLALDEDMAALDALERKSFDDEASRNMPPEPGFLRARQLSLESLNSEQCGKPEVAGSRVVSGKDATLGEWPWQAWLQQPNGKHWCGGTLITPEWVMTAAHCLRFKNEGDYHVILGDVNQNKPEGVEQRFTVRRIVKHPLFSKPVPYQNDVALLQLSRPAHLTAFVKTACLPGKSEDVPSGTTCFVSGWGQVGGDAKQSAVLQQAAMPVVPNTVCAAKLDSSPFGGLKTDNRTWKVTSKMLCAGDAGRTETGACYGDSGGPFQCQNSAGQWVVQGIVSWGDPNCSSRWHYSVFARVSEFRDWIERKIKQYSD